MSTGIGKDVNSVPHQSTQHAHAWIFLTAKICMPETQSSDDFNAILINIKCNNHTITWGCGVVVKALAEISHLAERKRK